MNKLHHCVLTNENEKFNKRKEEFFIYVKKLKKYKILVSTNNNTACP